MAATLLFVHGNGFCKETWRPIARRLQQSPLFGRLQQRSGGGGAIDWHALCLPLHGEKHDPRAHEDAVVFYENGDANSPRVRHAMNNWPQLLPDVLYPEIQALRERCDAQSPSRRPLIGIGHSMGAATLWATEARHPGTFDGLVLFEPVYGETTTEYSKSVDFLVNITLQRDHKWPSKEAAHAFFESYPNYASWDRESLRLWVDGAVVTDSQDGTSAVLSNHPLTEAAVYAGKRLELSEDELARPKCRIHLHSAARTRLFDVPTFQGIADRHPDIYKLYDPMPSLGHLMVFEDPAASSAAILRGLEELLADDVDEVAATSRL